MQDLFFGLGKFLEATFDWLLVPFSNLGFGFGIANVLIALIMAVGMVYWLLLQRRLSRKAIDEETYV